MDTMGDATRYGLYVEDDDGSMRLDHELMFDENGHVELDVPPDKRWALGILTKGPTFNLAGPYNGPAPTALISRGTL